MALEQNIMIYHSVRKTEVRELSQQRALQRFPPQSTNVCRERYTAAGCNCERKTEVT